MPANLIKAKEIKAIKRLNTQFFATQVFNSCLVSRRPWCKNSMLILERSREKKIGRTQIHHSVLGAPGWNKE